MAIDRRRRDPLDTAPRFYPGEDGFTKEQLEYMLEYKEKREEREYRLRVSQDEFIRFANMPMALAYREFGKNAVFRKYFGEKDYSDRGSNTIYMQIGLVSPRDLTKTIDIKEINMKTGTIDIKKIHPLYDEIEALEEMCLEFRTGKGI